VAHATPCAATRRNSVEDRLSDKRLLYLSYAEIEALGVTMADVIDALEIAFREKGQGKVEEHKI
jgi:hypothetical protein